MRKRKHTPGPWTPIVKPPASRADNGLRALAQVWGGWIVAVPKRLVGRLTHDAEANARLIAAAPELLDAVQLFVTWEDWIDDPDWRALVEYARSAIAKATGGEGAE